jgi:hypothetical protein
MIAGRFLVHPLLLTLLLSGCVRTVRFPNVWSDRFRARVAVAIGSFPPTIRRRGSRTEFREALSSDFIRIGRRSEVTFESGTVVQALGQR